MRACHSSLPFYHALTPSHFCSLPVMLCDFIFSVLLLAFALFLTHANMPKYASRRGWRKADIFISIINELVNMWKFHPQMSSAFDESAASRWYHPARQAELTACFSTLIILHFSDWKSNFRCNVLLSQWGPTTVRFFKISSFVFNIRKLIQV